jgi:uncharacterized BrkB/YihY/UPF0761 family membrane protein
MSRPLPQPLPRPLPPPDPASRAGATPDAPAEKTSGLKARQEQAKAKVEQMRRDLEAARPRSRTIDVAFATVEHDVATGGAVLGAALAFRIFLFLVPYVFVLVYGFGLATDASSGDPHDMAQKLGIAGLMASTIDTAAEQSLFTRIVVFVTASITLVIASRSLLKVLAITHALVWAQPVRSYPRLTRSAIALVVILTAGLALVQALTWLRGRSFFVGLVGELLFILVPTGLWLLFSWRHLAHPDDATWKDLIPGAVLIGVGVQILHFVTVFWITRYLASKSETYGAIGSALAILLWAYLCGRLMAGSAVLNAAWYERRDAT